MTILLDGWRFWFDRVNDNTRCRADLLVCEVLATE